ncbi:MAG TPA: carboxypeptidase M32 [Gaiellaceae bacterium]|nr:carboxypeptidase M32 [Gaiellaceae bacterium]
MSERAVYGQLRERLGQLWDLAKLGGLAAWDQQTMMPPQGAGVRAHQLATVSKICHDLLVSDELGKLLDDLRPYEESLEYDSNEASLIRVARRDREKELRVPGELREEQSLSAAEAYPVWVEARRTSNYELFRPHLERNVDLRRRYAACFDVDEPYDALLDDFERGMKTEEVRVVFERLKEGLVPLIAAAAEQQIDDSILRGRFPLEAQERLQRVVLERFGFREGSWRIDPTEHPFASSMGTGDIRMTTRFPEDEFNGVFAAMHEGGHAIYEHNIDPALERTPLCRGVSLALHESQSRMFENLVGRSLPFWRWTYPHVQQFFPEQFGSVELEDFHRAINKVQPSLIRIEADEATYSLHIILRFELEQELIAGAFDLRELPRIWNDRMGEYLGVEVSDDAHGVLQDVHWSRGTVGYFPTYALGNVVSVQIWEKVLEDVPDLEQHLERAELGPLHDWLRDRLWRHGRKFTPQETLERVVGGGLDPEPYLRYLSTKLGALAGSGSG